MQVNNRGKNVEESMILNEKKRTYPRKMSVLSTTYQQNVDKLITVFRNVCKVIFSDVHCGCFSTRIHKFNRKVQFHTENKHI